MEQKAATIIILLCVTAAFGYKSYSGYEVYSIKITNARHRVIVSSIEDHFSGDQVDIWKHPTEKTNGIIMIAPSQKRRLRRYLTDHGIKVSRLPLNVPRLVRNQRLENNFRRISNMFRSSDRKKMHTYYMRHQEIIKWMKEKVNNCSRPLICSTQIIGRTAYNRTLEIIKISTPRLRNQQEKKIVWLDAGIHAREWVSPSTAIYVIDEFLKYGRNARGMLQRFDFYILPLLNPDGYEFTHTHTRFWRKNLIRSANSNCYGVDLNRNWGYHWGGSGASSLPCKENYRGSRAFSELETKAVRNYLWNIRNKVQLFITLHSFGQYILTPFSHRRTTYPNNIERLRVIAGSVAQRMEAFSGRFYEVGTAADLLYEAAGGSDDFAKAVLGIPYTFTIELPDEGRYGFLMPPSYIIHIGQEMWIALREFIDII